MNTAVVLNQNLDSLIAEVPPLRESVKQSWDNYILQLGGEEPSNIHEMFLEQVELPLLLAVLKYTGNNQSRAAKIMGLSRGTLRKKLKLYGLL